MTVAQLVKEKKDSQKSYIKKEEARIKRKATTQHRKDFEACVQTVMHTFEKRFFSADDTDEKVADIIVNNPSKIIVDKSGVQYRTLKYGFDWKDTYLVNYMPSVKFCPDDHGKTLIENHIGYCEWKNHLEKKFGIKIYIRRSFTYRERDEAPSDKIFEGIRATVKLQQRR